MKILIDTNIILEMIMEQERCEEAQRLFIYPSGHDFFMSDFSVHSIGIFLFRRKQQAGYRSFIQDMLIKIGVKIRSLTLDDTDSIISVAQKFNLDFDDAYQYAVADKFDLTIVSFDRDFERTSRGRKLPIEIPI